MVNFFILRPIFASAIAIIMVLAGAISYFLLPVSQFPDITPPQIVVAANYPGASAQVVADTVTTPLEQQLNGVPGMLYMSSTSSNDGSSRITISFEVGYDVDIAAMDVQNRVSQAAPSLPALVNQTGVTVIKQNPNFNVLVNLSSPDKSVDFTTLSNYAYLQIADPDQAPARVSATSCSSASGAIRCASGSTPTRWRASASPPSMCRTSSPSRTSRSRPARSASRRRPPERLRDAGQRRRPPVSDPEQFGEIVLRVDPETHGRGRPGCATWRKHRAGRAPPTRLRSISATGNGEEQVVVLAVLQAPGSNALDLQGRVKAKMDELSSRFPAGMSATTCSTTRRASCRRRWTDVIVTLVEALLLVVFVVFIFLQSWRATIIPLIAIPVSLIATLVGDVSARLLAQHAVAARHGARHRPGRRRRHRRGRERRAPARGRAWRRSPPRARIAMQEVTGPIIATTGGAAGGVRAGRLHSRRGRPASTTSSR
jgi:hypothetical protein